MILLFYLSTIKKVNNLPETSSLAFLVALAIVQSLWFGKQSLFVLGNN